jgi:hypothetical protein
MVQPSVKLERGFAFVSFALAEEFSSVLKLSGSGRRLLVLADERQQLRQLVLAKFFFIQYLLPGITHCLCRRLSVVSPASASRSLF